MKKKTIFILLCLGLVLLCVTAMADVAIDAEHFPDAGFRNYVQKFDKDKDLTLSSSELEKVTSIDVKQRGLTSLNGIEYFTSLNSLECSSNRLTKLDLSSNIVLKTLQCYSNQLMELDVSRCAKLDFLNCSDNKLTKLDVIMNTGLRCLNFTRNQLTEIDLSKNTGLIELWCESNRLTKLDVGNNNRLEIIDCYDNRLTELDVSTNVNLKRFSCNSNQLTELDVSKNTVLRELRCSSNKLTELDISKCPELIRLVEKYTPGQNSSGYGWWNDNTNCLLVDQSVNVITEAAISPGSPWDCPECGRTGNTGNFCGGCAHPAPWIESDPGTSSSHDDVNEELRTGIRADLWDIKNMLVLGEDVSRDLIFEDGSTRASLTITKEKIELLVYDTNKRYICLFDDHALSGIEIEDYGTTIASILPVYTDDSKSSSNGFNLYRSDNGERINDQYVIHRVTVGGQDCFIQFDNRGDSCEQAEFGIFDSHSEIMSIYYSNGKLINICFYDDYGICCADIEFRQNGFGEYTDAYLYADISGEDPKNVWRTYESRRFGTDGSRTRRETLTYYDSFQHCIEIIGYTENGTIKYHTVHHYDSKGNYTGSTRYDSDGNEK